MGSGYLHPAYAKALSSIGTPFELPRSGGWVLVRSVPDSYCLDGVGCYPLFTCRDWENLPSDIEEIKGTLVSLSLVADPFGKYDESLLRRCFPDIFFAYKQHYVIDLRHLPQFISRHHARNVRKARGKVDVEFCPDPEMFADEWAGLYCCLVQLRAVKGMAAFSAESLARQLRVPGLVMFRAVCEGETVGAILWFVQEDVGYYHLAAYNAAGYALGASFALFSRSIEFFESRLRWLNLGAGAGIHCSGKDGLTRFKSGWATGTRTAYFCGRILDIPRYRELVARQAGPGTGYFPAYRRGEFQ